jgi:hypothetical protein
MWEFKSLFASQHLFLRYLDTYVACTRVSCRHGPSMEPYVSTSMVQLLCRTVKLAWFDSDQATSIVDDCKVRLLVLWHPVPCCVPLCYSMLCYCMLLL